MSKPPSAPAPRAPAPTRGADRTAAPGADRPPAYILAGGRSRRFGRDKARVEVEGAPLIVHVAAAARAAGVAARVIGRAPGAFADLGLPTLTDATPDLGPLGGLQAALGDAGAGWVMLLACDLYGLRARWLRALLAARRPGDLAVALRAPADPALRSGGWQPLIALYHADALAEVEARLARGERAMWRLLEALGARALPVPPDWSRLVVVNAPEDLARCRADDAR